MITFSVIQKSQLEGAMRLDAEFYCVSNDLLCKFVTGKDAIEFAQYGTSKELNESSRGFRVLRLNEFEDFFITEPSKYCDIINKITFNELKLKSGDVLICRTNGNPKLVGKAAIVMEDTEIAFASYLFRVRPKKELINSATLVSFLNSRFGRAQIERFLMPSIQSNFSPAQFRAIKIPIFPKNIQEEIEALVKNSYILKNQAKRFYFEAESLLLEELGMKNFEADENLSSIVNLSDVKSAHRMDAEYFQKKYKTILDKLSKKSQSNLSELFSIIRGKNFNYKDDGEIGVIKTKQLGKQKINFEVESKTSSEITEKEKLPILKNGDVVFASMGVGSLGKTNIFYDLDAPEMLFTIDSTIKIFRQKEKNNVLPEVLVVFFNSWVGQELIYKYIVGSSGIISIYENSLNEFKIPILQIETQQKISNLVRQSHEARKKAKELLEEAKRKAEEMIERGG